MVAYKAATDDENVAENKYDTLGLEASYLAQGQAQRVAECEADLATYKQLVAESFSMERSISIGAVIKLLDEHDEERYLYMGPSAGGVKFDFEAIEITVITPSSPLGQALMGCRVDDEVSVDVAGKRQLFEIVALY